MVGIFLEDYKTINYDGISFGNHHGKYLRCNKSIRSNRKKIELHRYIYAKYVDADIEGYHIHHLDGNTLNNMVCNLIKLTPEQHRIVHRNDCIKMYISKEEWRRRLLNAIPTKKVCCITTGIEYNSIKDASEATGVAGTSITACARGKLRIAGKATPERPELKWAYVS